MCVAFFAVFQAYTSLEVGICAKYPNRLFADWSKPSKAFIHVNGGNRQLQITWYCLLIMAARRFRYCMAIKRTYGTRNQRSTAGEPILLSSPISVLLQQLQHMMVGVAAGVLKLDIFG